MVEKGPPCCPQPPRLPPPATLWSGTTASSFLHELGSAQKAGGHLPPRQLPRRLVCATSALQVGAPGKTSRGGLHVPVPDPPFLVKGHILRPPGTISQECSSLILQ